MASNQLECTYGLEYGTTLSYVTTGRHTEPSNQASTQITATNTALALEEVLL